MLPALMPLNHVVGQDKGNKDGLLHGLIRWALASPVGFPAGEATQGELQGELF